MTQPNHITEKQRRNARQATSAKRRACRKRHFANSCRGKIRHAAKQGAVIHLKKMNQADLSAYPCRHCGGWHIGHRRMKFQMRIDQVLSAPCFTKS